MTHAQQVTIRRWWTDTDGIPREEVALWVCHPEGVQVQPGPHSEADGAVPPVPMAVAMLVTPATDTGSNPNQLYQVPVREGATLITRDAYEAALETRRLEQAAAAADVDAQLAAMKAETADRRAASIRKLAEAAGIPADEVGDLIEGLR